MMLLQFLQSVVYSLYAHSVPVVTNDMIFEITWKNVSVRYTILPKILCQHETQWVW